MAQLGNFHFQNLNQVLCQTNMLSFWNPKKCKYKMKNFVYMHVHVIHVPSIQSEIAMHRSPNLIKYKVQFSKLAAVVWLKYCGYAIKHQMRNQSINQNKLAQISSQIWMTTFPWWMDHCAFLSVRDVIIANEGWPTVFTVILVMACNINTDPGISELWSVVPARYDLGPLCFCR